MKQKTSNNYYMSTPESILNDAGLIKQFLMSCDGQGVNEVMQEYFKPYWDEFCKFWVSEQLDWLNFALAPHNSYWFIIYVFQEYPEIRKRVMNDYHGKEA